MHTLSEKFIVGPFSEEKKEAYRRLNPRTENLLYD
jgi:hypothetical protein